MSVRYTMFGALLFGLVTVCGYQNAWAEGMLMRSVPRDNEVVSNFDGQIKLWFSGNVSERSPTLVVLNEQGQRLDNSDLKLTLADRSELTATTKPLAVGNYAVRYRVVTDDGLIVSGILHFSVKN